ncbi:hypothetical protein GALL_472400 [mine drainage metagenome]|uniref:Uncharacterized protein n=1 Tax=mine drainage metagenome TaxID=410659 RepID=A0A1J5Q0X3_9ZZZZ
MTPVTVLFYTSLQFRAPTAAPRRAGAGRARRVGVAHGDWRFRFRGGGTDRPPPACGPVSPGRFHLSGRPGPCALWRPAWRGDRRPDPGRLREPVRRGVQPCGPGLQHRLRRGVAAVAADLAARLSQDSGPADQCARHHRPDHRGGHRPALGARGRAARRQGREAGRAGRVRHTGHGSLAGL